MTTKYSRDLIRCWNVYVFGGTRPSDVSAARWQGMIRFFNTKMIVE